MYDAVTHIHALRRIQITPTCIISTIQIFIYLSPHTGLLLLFSFLNSGHRDNSASFGLLAINQSELVISCDTIGISKMYDQIDVFDNFI